MKTKLNLPDIYKVIKLQCNEKETVDKSEYHTSRKTHQKALEVFKQYLKDEGLNKKEVFSSMILSNVIGYSKTDQVKFAECCL